MLETYRMFANSKCWLRRMEDDIRSRPLRRGGGREGAVAVPRPDGPGAPTPTCATGCTTSTTCRTGCCGSSPARAATPARAMPEDPILVARNIGPGELLDYGRARSGRSCSRRARSAATPPSSPARWAIPLVIQAERITRRGAERRRDPGRRRPGRRASCAPRRASPRLPRQDRHAGPRRRSATPRCATCPRTALCGTTVSLHMNAGLMADLPSLPSSGAEGVGLFRTELQFLVRNQMPKRHGAGGALRPRPRQRRGGKRGGLPHARHRLGQGPALHEAAATSRTRRWAGGRSASGSTSRACCGCSCRR